MNILFLILSALVMIVSLILGFQNRGKLIETRKEKDETNTAIIAKISEIEGVNESIVEVIGEKQDMWTERNDALATLDVAKRNLADAESQYATVQSTFAKNKSRYDFLQEELKKLPPGVNPDTLGEDIERYKRELAKLQEELTSVNKEVDIAEKELARETHSLARQTDYQKERNVSFGVNSIEAKVTAVDRAWGFAVINAGEKQGISAESDLLVLSADRTPKAKLNIIQLDSNQLVANIDYLSTKATERIIRAGDSVILRKPNTGIQ